MIISFSNIRTYPFAERTGEDTYRAGTQFRNKNGELLAIVPVDDFPVLYGEWHDEYKNTELCRFIEKRRLDDTEAKDILVKMKAENTFNFMLSFCTKQNYCAYAFIGSDLQSGSWYAIRESDWNLFCKNEGHNNCEVYHRDSAEDKKDFKERYTWHLYRTLFYKEDRYYAKAYLGDDNVQYMTEYEPETTNRNIA